ncbi:hypothetical protein MHC_03950 [Mycoplasma haemocanis str. Illinois]|uniref:Uncharacterized protein n=1 Tax=Mycoplasma haemocanis (strain Illinois) TaxID=1111676 RepID=H6N7M6_MYCHN|nr:hypothetical protein [Mycoplasma haemocanis]AEW45648.1 hypothetical protein MHC_03950 [Mycoplasma haemocanis str. Illinois]
MPILYAKLLKVGGPILTGIGGVIATSSLVSKNAEEKLEDRFKTKALSDEDPKIKEWKDRNESDQEGDGEGSPNNGTEGEGQMQNASNSESESTGEQTDSKGSEDSKSAGEEGEKSTDEGEKLSEGASEDTAGTGDNEGTESESSSDGVTDNGTNTAENNHVAGTAWGTRDSAMTQQEVNNAKHLKGELETQLSELLRLAGVV